MYNIELHSIYKLRRMTPREIELTYSVPNEFIMLIGRLPYPLEDEFIKKYGVSSLLEIYIRFNLTLDILKAYDPYKTPVLRFQRKTQLSFITGINEPIQPILPEFITAEYNFNNKEWEITAPIDISRSPFCVGIVY